MVLFEPEGEPSTDINTAKEVFLTPNPRESQPGHSPLYSEQLSRTIILLKDTHTSIHIVSNYSPKEDTSSVIIGATGRVRNTSTCGVCTDPLETCSVNRNV